MSIAIYARVSTNEQAEQGVSIEVQLAQCRAYAAREGTPVVAEYVDVQSGTDPTRPQYQRMLADAKRKMFDQVLVWRVDRFGRNAAEAFTALQQFEHLGVRLASLAEPGQDPFVRGIYVLVAEQFSRKLSDAVRPAMQHQAEEGKHLGPAPFGYIKTAKYTLVPDPIVAPVVRQMFQKYAAGHESIQGLCRWLSSLGYKRSDGTVRYALKNPIYIGILRWGRQKHSIFQKYGITPEDKWTQVPAHCEPIVSKELFAAVQERINRNFKRPSFGREPRYLLAGMLKCGRCGHNVSSVARGERGAHGYRCQFGARTGRCDLPYLHGPNLEEHVLQQLFTYADLIAGQSADELTAKAIAQADADPMQTRMKDIERAIDTQEQRRKRLTYELIDGTIAKETYLMLDKEIGNNLDLLRRELAQFMVPRRAVNYVAVRTQMAALRQAWDGFTLAQQREVIAQIADSIIIHDKLLYEIVVSMDFAPVL